MLEKEIQKTIIDYLRLKGQFVYKNVSIGTYKKETDSYIPMSTKGIADLTAIKKGKVYQIEVKKIGGKQNTNQKQFQKDWEAKGGIYLLGGLNDMINAGL